MSLPEDLDSDSLKAVYSHLERSDLEALRLVCKRSRARVDETVTAVTGGVGDRMY